MARKCRRSRVRPVPPGVCQVHVRGYGAARARVTPVTATVLVWGNDEA
jgi:hypothetical protein